jgi:hypothetical protein
MNILMLVNNVTRNNLTHEVAVYYLREIISIKLPEAKVNYLNILKVRHPGIYPILMPAESDTPVTDEVDFFTTNLYKAMDENDSVLIYNYPQWNPVLKKIIAEYPRQDKLISWGPTREGVGTVLTFDELPPVARFRAANKHIGTVVTGPTSYEYISRVIQDRNLVHAYVRRPGFDPNDVGVAPLLPIDAFTFYYITAYSSNDPLGYYEALSATTVPMEVEPDWDRQKFVDNVNEILRNYDNLIQDAHTEYMELVQESFNTIRELWR